jgi:hypothetical protein
VSHLTVFIPALFSELIGATGEVADPGRWPATNGLLARATVSAMTFDSIEHALFAEFARAPGDVPVAIPAAALTAPFDAVAETSHATMRADPVYLRADPNQILLFNNVDIMPSAEEADELLAALNAGFDEIRFFRGRDPARWYTDLSAVATTRSPFAANGRSISGFMPAGDGARALQQCMNDAQMLLHEHPVNTARERRGLPPINSIWLWGAGIRPDRLAGPAFVCGNDALSAALAMHAGIHWRSNETGGDAISACASGAATGLAVIGAPTGAAGMAGDACSLGAFEEEWSGPLLRALNRRTLRRLTIVTDRDVYTTSPVDRFKFWRTARARQRPPA